MCVNVCALVFICVHVCERASVHMREKEQKKKRKWRNLNFEKIVDLAGIFWREVYLAPKCSQYLGS